MSAGETFDPNHTPADPVAAALDLFARMPVIIGREPDSEIATVYEDIAAMMGREGVLDGLDWVRFHVAYRESFPHRGR